MRLHLIKAPWIKATILAGISLLSLLVGGCATASRIPLTKATAPSGPVELLVTTQTQEIPVAFDESNLSQGGGGGLILALVDIGVNSSRAKKSESVVVPLRDAMVDYDANTPFFTTLRTDLPNGPAPLTFDNVQLHQCGTFEERESWINAHPGKTIFAVNFNCRITKEMDGIVFSAHATLYGAKEARHVMNYRNGFFAKIPLPGWPGGTPSQAAAIKIWASNGASKPRLAMATGIKEISQMIAYDLAQSGPADQKLYPMGDKAARVAIPLWSPWAARSKGLLVHTEPGRSWVRISTGELFSIPQS